MRQSHDLIGSYRAMVPMVSGFEDRGVLDWVSIDNLLQSPAIKDLKEGWFVTITVVTLLNLSWWSFGLVTIKVVTYLYWHDEVLQIYVTVMLITVILWNLSSFALSPVWMDLVERCSIIHQILKSSYVFFMVPKTLEPLGVWKFVSL